MKKFFITLSLALVGGVTAGALANPGWGGVVFLVVVLVSANI